jgi:hypothetical protein
MRASGGDFGRLLLAQAVAIELKQVCIVADAVENGIGKGRLTKQVMPRDRAGFSS